MQPCHTKPFVQPGILIEPTQADASEVCVTSPTDACDYCGSPRLGWRKCKLICDDCKQINKSCADL